MSPSSARYANAESRSASRRRHTPPNLAPRAQNTFRTARSLLPNDVFGIVESEMNKINEQRLAMQLANRREQDARQSVRNSFGNVRTFVHKMMTAAKAGSISPPSWVKSPATGLMLHAKIPIQQSDDDRLVVFLVTEEPEVGPARKRMLQVQIDAKRARAQVTKYLADAFATFLHTPSTEFAHVNGSNRRPRTFDGGNIHNGLRFADPSVGIARYLTNVTKKLGPAEITALYHKQLIPDAGPGRVRYSYEIVRESPQPQRVASVHVDAEAPPGTGILGPAPSFRTLDPKCKWAFRTFASVVRAVHVPSNDAL
jgi:hypothetical protein